MTEIQETVGINRKYRDRLFRLRFGSDEYKEDTLSINNAKYTIVNADKNNILTSHKYSKEKQRIYIVAREDDIYEIRKEYYTW